MSPQALPIAGLSASAKRRARDFAPKSPPAAGSSRDKRRMSRKCCRADTFRARPPARAEASEKSPSAVDVKLWGQKGAYNYSSTRRKCLSREPAPGTICSSIRQRRVGSDGVCCRGSMDVRGRAGNEGINALTAPRGGQRPACAGQAIYFRLSRHVPSEGICTLVHTHPTMLESFTPPPSLC